MISDLHWVNDPRASTGWIFDRWCVFRFRFVKHVRQETLPPAAGCYLLADDTGRFPYVGMSDNIRERLDRSHEVLARGDELGLAAVLTHTPHVNDWWTASEVEAIFYDRFLPPLNRQRLTPPEPYAGMTAAAAIGDWQSLNAGLERLREIGRGGGTVLDALLAKALATQR